MSDIFEPLRGMGREVLTGYTEREAKEAAALIGKVLDAVPEDPNKPGDTEWRDKMNGFILAAHLY